MEHLIKEFKQAGLLKGTKQEAFHDANREARIDKKTEMGTMAGGAGGGTNTGSIDVGISPMGMTRRKWPQEMQEEISEKCEGILETIKRLSEIYEDMTGKKVGEAFCPDCKPFDLSPSTPDKGTKSTASFSTQQPTVPSKPY